MVVIQLERQNRKPKTSIPLLPRRCWCRILLRVVPAEVGHIAQFSRLNHMPQGEGEAEKDADAGDDDVRDA